MLNLPDTLAGMIEASKLGPVSALMSRFGVYFMKTTTTGADSGNVNPSWLRCVSGLGGNIHLVS